MVAAETYLNVRESCGARSLPNRDAAVLYEIPKGTDVKFLRDEDRDFIKVAYEGRPVYVPRNAVAPTLYTVPERRLLQSFVLRRDTDPVLNAVLMAAGALVAAGWLSLFQLGSLSSSWFVPLIAVGVMVVLSLGFWIFGRHRRAYIDICNDAIVLRPSRRWEIPADEIEVIQERRVGVLDTLRISFHYLMPWCGTTLTLPPYPSGRMLQMTLSKGLAFGWWPFRIRFRRVLFDPKDRAGFLKALREGAPQVRIDPTLAAEYGV